MSDDGSLLQIVDALNGIRDEVRAIREQLERKPTATIELPERCHGIPESRCALAEEDARRSIGNFTNPNRWQCVGCGVRSDP